MNVAFGIILYAHVAYKLGSAFLNSVMLLSKGWQTESPGKKGSLFLQFHVAQRFRPCAIRYIPAS